MHRLVVTVLPMPIQSVQSDLCCVKKTRAPFGAFNIERMRLGEAEGISRYRVGVEMACDV